MRGEDEASEGLFSYVSCSARVPKDHPLRTISHIIRGAQHGSIERRVWADYRKMPL
jgi:hypothetical protein